MQKLKFIPFSAGVMLFVLSAVTIYLSIQELSDIRPAGDYEDQGVYTFLPYDVQFIQVKNTSASSRDRRMHPTTTVYMVLYRDTSGAGYRWQERTPAPELGEKTVEAGQTVARRVLSIPSSRTYITVEPEQSAQSYTDGLRQKYSLFLGLSVAYILFYLAVWSVIRAKSSPRR